MEVIEADFEEVKTTVLIDRVELPDLSDIKNEALSLQSGIFPVEDEDTNNRAGLMIKNAAAFIKRVDDRLDLIGRPLLEAKREVDRLKNEFKAPAERCMAYLRGESLAWQKAEQKRLQDARDLAVRKAMEEQAKRDAEIAEARSLLTPFDDPAELIVATPEPDIAAVIAMTTKAASAFTGLKKGPVKVQLVDINLLVQAAAKDPALQQYLSIDEKMLTAWAKKVGVEKFNIPGVAATQEDILARK
jgi:hypothetical protein